MTKTDIIRKLTSRKFWLAVALFVTGLIIAFGGSKETAETVSGCIMQGAAVLGYLLAEGLNDAASIRGAANTTNNNLIMEGIAVEDLTDEQLRSLLDQMGYTCTEDMTRVEMLAELDALTESE